MLIDCRNNGNCNECEYSLMDKRLDGKVVRNLDRYKVYNWKAKDGSKDRSSTDYIYYLETHGHLISCCDVSKE